MTDMKTRMWTTKMMRFAYDASMPRSWRSRRMTLRPILSAKKDASVLPALSECFRPCSSMSISPRRIRSTNAVKCGLCSLKTP